MPIPRGAVLFACLTAVLVSACGKQSGELPLSSPPAVLPKVLAVPPLALAKTADLVKDPELARRIDALAALGRIESSGIGAAGAPSAVYAAWAAVLEKAKPDDVLALLRHGASNVRGYAALEIFGGRPAEAKALLPLLGDPAVVDRVNGCEKSAESMADLVVAGLCQHAKTTEAQDVLLAAVGGSLRGNTGARALTCVASARPKEASAFAQAFLARGGPESAQEDAITALALAAPEGCAALVALAPSSSPQIRATQARALGACASPDALTRIQALMKDSSARVVGEAGASYLRHPGRDPAKARAMMTDEAHSLGYAQELAKHPSNEEGLALVEAWLLAHPKNGTPIETLRLGSKTPEANAMIRRLARVTAPVQTSERQPLAIDFDWVRSEIIVYLYELRDPQDLPEMERSLDSWVAREVDLARRAVVDAKDAKAIPILEAQVLKGNNYAKQMAAQTLVALGSSASASSVESAATTGDARTDEALKKAAAALRALPSK